MEIFNFLLGEKIQSLTETIASYINRLIQFRQIFIS